MRSLLTGILFFLFLFSTQASELRVLAKEYAGEKAVLFGYHDYYSMSENVLGEAWVNDTGLVVIPIEIDKTSLVKLRIDHVVADFFLEANRDYTIQFNRPEKGVARTLNGSTKVGPLFIDLDHLDINALLTNMNAHIESFLLQEYQRTKVRDQEAAGKARVESIVSNLDSTVVRRSNRPARIDTFELKIRNFYSEVEHPYFKEQLEYALAQLRVNSDHSRKALFERYLKDRPINHSSTEYVKFFKKFFKGFLLQDVYGKHPTETVNAINQLEAETLDSLFALNDFVAEKSLRELVILNELYFEHGNEKFNKSAVLALIRGFKEGQAGTSSLAFEKELTRMASGTDFPSTIELWSPVDATTYQSDTLFNGYTYVVLTASWCSYCQREVEALQGLIEEYGQHVNFTVLSIDKNVDEYRDNEALKPSGAQTFYVGDDAVTLQKLNVRSIPSFYFLEGNRIIRGPAQSPSEGVGREFHKIKVAAQEGKKIKVWDD